MIGSAKKWRPLFVREGTRWDWIKFDLYGPVFRVKLWWWRRGKQSD